MTSHFLTWRRNAAAALLLLVAAYGSFEMPGLAARWGVSATGVALATGWALLVGLAFASTTGRVRREEWALLAAGAIALRLASATLAADRASPGDSHAYVEIAQNLLAGRGLVFDEPYLRLAVRAFYPPLYPLLLAGWGALLGFGTASMLVLSTLIDLAAAVLLALLGRRAGEKRAGLAAALIYLLWPSVVLSAPLAQKEGLAVLLALALAHGWIGVREGRGSVPLVGLATGALALTQPGWATLSPFVGLAMIPPAGWRRVLAVGVPAAAIAALALAPWWIRNWRLFGAFVPLTSASGLSLWIGENPEATGRWMPYPPALAGSGELEAGRAAGRIATDWIVGHPLAVAELNARKLMGTLGTAQAGIVRLAAMHPGISAAVTAALLPLAQFAHVSLMIAGAVATRFARRRSIPTALVAAGLAQLVVFGVWFEFDERHREFLTPLLIFAATTGWAAFRRRTAPAAAVSASPAA